MSTKAEAIDKIVLLLISGISREAAADYATSELSIAPDKAKAAVAEARRKITRAADYNRDEEFGKAITRYNDLYGRAVKAQDTKTAIQAQGRLDKLLALYAGPEDGAAAGGESADATLARKHLVALNLASDAYPLQEHARLAAQRIVELEAMLISVNPDKRTQAPNDAPEAFPGKPTAQDGPGTTITERPE